jgi:hypothetical protein
MKSTLTLFLCLFMSWARAQTPILPVDSDTHLVTYAGVVQTPAAAQAELYTRAKLWFANTFKSAKDVIEADEKDAHLVQGSAWSPLTVHMLGPNLPVSDIRLWFTVKLLFKEGRYRYEISSLQYQPAPSASFPNTQATPIERVLANWATATKPRSIKIREELKQEINRAATELEASIKAAMAKPVNGKSDW